jgi:RimJ/RimL family protein N-acetyltransferase
VLASTRLTDGVVELRPPRRRDVDELFGAVRESLPELVPWMAWCHPDYSTVETAEWVRNAKRWWEQDVEYPFVIRSVAGDALLGTCGLSSLDRVNRWANLGYWLRTAVTGHGSATRAARLVAGFGLGVVGLERIEILAATGNHASQAVARRAGAVEEGVLRRRLRVQDTTHDAVVFSLVRGDDLAPGDR